MFHMRLLCAFMRFALPERPRTGGGSEKGSVRTTPAPFRVRRRGVVSAKATACAWVAHNMKEVCFYLFLFIYSFYYSLFILFGKEFEETGVADANPPGRRGFPQIKEAEATASTSYF